MPRQVKSSEDELFALCDEIQAIDGKVTAVRLREAAGGGGHIRLKAVVEAWRERRHEAAKPAEAAIRKKPGGAGEAGKSQGRGGSPDQGVEAPAKGGLSRRSNKDAAETVTLEDAEQARIAMEAGRVKAALSGGDATKTETPDEPDVLPSIEQAEAEVTEALDAIAGQETEDGLALGKRRQGHDIRHPAVRRNSRRAGVGSTDFIRRGASRPRCRCRDRPPSGPC